jgi:glycosyltransferase involved in cell wall biosynthesis
MTPRVSVVIPTYRRPHFVRRAIESVFAQDLAPDDFELIVVDSSPDDETAQVVEELRIAAPCALTLIRKKPEGAGPSRYAGAMAARAEIVALMDSDCRAHPGWLRAGLAAFADGVGLVQGWVGPDPEVPVSPRMFWVEVFGETVFYPAANIFYRRACVEAAGAQPADPTPWRDRPIGGEDTILAWRVKRAGWASRFAPDAIVYHEVKPMTLRFWLVDRHRPLSIVPSLVREIPELRSAFFLRWFFDRHQAGLVLGVIGTALAWLTPLTLLAWLPYAAMRIAAPTRQRGVRRLARPLFYIGIDLVCLGYLVAGSVRARRLVL